MGSENRAEALSLYLVGLAILQGNGKTYVNYEISEVMEAIKKELGFN